MCVYVVIRKELETFIDPLERNVKLIKRELIYDDDE